MPAEIDINLMTIEHIRPQSDGEETGDEFDVGAIGNLLLIKEELNVKLGDKPFSVKKPFFTRANSVYCDEFLLEADRWTYDKIAERGVHLAQIGYEEIWNL